MKLLVTARDVGATVNIIEIVKEALLDKEIELYIYAQNPAPEYFYNAGINMVNEIKFLPVTDSKQKEANDLLSFSKHLIDELKPDAVLSGLSSPRDAGIDEAIIAVCSNKIKTFVMQDFWGEVNTFFGKLADYYLCLDTEAARLTKENYNTGTVIIGSPRHAPYSDLSLPLLKEQLRNKIKVTAEQKIVGLFGQSLHFLPGYYDTIKDMLSSIRKNASDTIILYRKHPRETKEEAKKIIDLIMNAGLDLRILDENRVEYSLLICDLVCSIFSNCIYDSCYLNYFSDSPLIVPALLSYNSDIIEYAKKFNVYNSSPYQKQKLAFICESKNSMDQNLNYLLSSKCREEYWHRIKLALENPCHSAKKAVSAIKEITLKDMKC
ncbi:MULTISPECIES: hypothetical protein [unclassified Legionella]|uniref:hypothetical protein n=1 Tax=unclassified Legionella TaxID=2622702 RepID=UPI001A944311|nr:MULTISPECIES: hypothetical protein [unclassified Legionella]MDI9817762.1 hypothetical protein [Legionella sp. PL877]